MYFEKFHGAGNDFVIIDNRTNDIFKTINNKTRFIQKICHRRTGVGADGLIELRNSTNSDFRMIYYNSDGDEGTMCGNAGRCIAAYANNNNIAGKKMQFEAIDGLHQAEIIKVEENITKVFLKLNDVSDLKIEENHIIINTGSPHYITFVNNLEMLNVYSEGKKLRSDQIFQPKGINVNFVELFNDYIYVRTFERGVEDETLSCGTGVTASAIASYIKGVRFQHNEYPVQTKGGKLYVKFDNYYKNKFNNIWLKGDAVKVFKGETMITQ